MGVSADKEETQRRFIERFGLTFPLISDPKGDIIETWGAGQVLGVIARRSTFLVGTDGRIAYAWPKVSVQGHAEDVVAKVRELTSA